MIKFFVNFDQVMIAFFAIIIVCYSFRALNCCTKNTLFSVRVPLILFLAASVGALLFLVSGVRIEWPYGLLITAVAFHLVSDRRNHRQQDSNYFQTINHK